MAADKKKDDGKTIDDASLDDFFQPPSEDEFFQDPEPEETIAAEEQAPPLPEEAPGVDAVFDERADEEEDSGISPELLEPAGTAQEKELAETSQVEDLPITEGAPAAGGKKKGLIVALALLSLLAVVGLGYIFLLGGEEPRSPGDELVATEEVSETDIAIEDDEESPFEEKEGAEGQAEGSPPADAAKGAALPTEYRTFGRLELPDGVPGASLVNRETGRLAEDASSKLPAARKGYSLLIGSFIVRADIGPAQKAAAAAGVGTKVVPADKVRVRMKRLFVRNFEQLAEAKRAKEKLKRSGLDAFILKEGPFSYDLYAGSFVTDEKYKEYYRKLASSGYSGEKREVPAEISAFRLQSRKVYKNAKEMEEDLIGLLKKGINPRIVPARR